MGVEHRMISVDGTPIRIFGIVDFCVTASARSRGLGGVLLATVEELGRASGVDAIVLFADDPRLYLAAGYRESDGQARWVMINEHETLGIAERPVDGMMGKMLSGKPWQPQLVDLLGHMY
jgi:predicted N-acetyltransferase YhbS